MWQRSPTGTVLRPLTPDDIQAAQVLSASFHWPHRREDWAAMLALGEGVVAARTGQLVGTAMCWRYGADWATMGMIMVAEALHGQGMGRQMMEALMKGLHGRSITLHATRAGMKLYAALGFEPVGTVLQHQGPVAQAPLIPPPAGMRLRPAARPDLAALAALDRAAGGMDRTALLAVLLEFPGGIVLDNGGEAAGFALTRPFGRGRVIGPVVAGNAEAAHVMIAHLLGQRTGQFVRIDIPRESGLGPFLKAQGLEEVDTVIPMVRGAMQPSGAVQVFGLASQAYG